MNDFNIPDEPDPKTKDDAYKLAMLAMHLKRLKNGDLDFNAAYGAWKDSINYIQTQYQGKSASELDFKGNVFKVYPLVEGLRKMEIIQDNWRNTFRKKFDKWGIPKDEAISILNRWSEFGITDFEVNQFRNEKMQPLPDN